MRFLALLSLALPCSAAAQVGTESFGVNAHVPDAAMLDACDALGVEWIRIDVNWRDVHTGPGSFDWAVIDTALDGASARGLSVFATLAYTPDWVPRVPRTRTDTYGGNDEPASSTEWVAFVDEAARHLRARGVTHLGLWNEPNLDGFWEEAAGLPSFVDTIVIPGTAAARAACPDCVLLGPELASVGPWDEAFDAIFRRVPPGTYDIVSHHIYQVFSPTGVSDSFFNVLERRRSAITRTSLRELLDLHGFTGEVWITEAGYRADPGDIADELVQADTMRDLVEAQLERAWWTNSFVYEIMDCGVDAPDCPIDGFGLVRPERTGPRSFPADFREKPAFDVLRSLLASRPELTGGGPMRACFDGTDDDGDGRTDLSDRGCASQLDDDESDDPPRRVLTALRGDGITIDGDLADIGASGGLSLGLDEDWVGTAVGVLGPTAAADLSVEVWARWDAAGVVLAVEVTDDTHAPRATLYAGDSLQIAVDADASGGDGYAAGDVELGLALVGSTVTETAYFGAPEAETAVVRGPRRTLYEVRLPASLFGGSLSAGDRIRFSLVVNENDDETTPDGTGRVGFLQLTAGIGLRKVPELFAELVLDARSELPDAGPVGAEAREPTSGCACRAGRSGSVGWALLALAALLWRRARR